MTNATAQLGIQYTPPNAATNSGNVAYMVTSPYNAQNVGQFDILSSEVAPITNSIPFGSVSQCLMLIIKNGQATDIGLRINGGAKLAGKTAVISGTAPTMTISGLSGMTSAAIGDHITISGSATPANNGTFAIVSIVNDTSVTINNAGGLADAGPLVWMLDELVDNFRIPSQGVFMFGSPTAATGLPTVGAPPVAVPEYIRSASVISYGIPGVGVTELISYFVFGN